MWASIASFILRNRVAVLIFLALSTAFMGYQARNVKMSYKFGGLLPKTDSTYVAYKQFVQQFGEDGNVIVVGVDDPALFELTNFQKWYDLGTSLGEISVLKDSIIDGSNQQIKKQAVDSVFSMANCYNISRDDTARKFVFKRLMTERPESQAQVDAMLYTLKNLPFYEGLLYTQTSNASLMTVFVNAELFNSEHRGTSVEDIISLTDKFTADTGIKLYLSGLPFIRTEMTSKVKLELKFFIILAAAVTALLILLFFRNFGVMLVCLLVVGVGVVWSMGFIGMFHYPISMLMGLIPPLMIVIGIPNCVYLLNKYHSEYKKHGNKALSLTRVIQKVGNATFMTNTTTALGFATFIFTHSDLLKQFGVIASINIMAVFIISIVTIPTIFSFLPAPTDRHVRHLDRRWLFHLVNRLVHIITRHRRKVYVVMTMVLLAGIYGISLIKTTGNLVDDLPQDDRVITDLHFFESHFNGIMPFEILVNSKKKGQITNASNLARIEKLQALLAEYPEFSKSLSLVDASKFAKQAFYGGDPLKYQLIKRNEQTFIGPYLKGNYNSNGIEKSFLDSTKSVTRISTQVADIGTLEMAALLENLRPRIDSIFPTAQYDITLTGTSVVFLEGTNYMVRNLFISLLIAIIVIALIMAFLFRSFRMVMISLLPNLIPLICTAAIMGYFGIAIKPSTILVFSIAFGISVDDTIHFLAKYRQELKLLQWNIKDSVILAVQETGTSMLYTSIVLFFGFGIFAASEFDGTRSLGVLVSVTLLIAMFTNLLVLPSLLLSFEKSITTKAFSEPLLEIIDEEEDIELEELRIRESVMTSDLTLENLAASDEKDKP